MQSFRPHVDNPWNSYISNGYVQKTICKYDERESTGYLLEDFLSSSLPVTFTRSHNIVNCGICKIIVVKNRFKQHYEDRHATDSSIGGMIPFQDYVLTENKIEKTNNIRRNRKKRANFKEKIKFPLEYLEKRKCKETKIRTVNKRHRPKSFLDGSSYLSNTKKLKLENKDVTNEKKRYFLTDEGFMSSSSQKQLDDDFFRKSKSSFDAYSVHDGVYCSNESVGRTSDSSTPPSLSLGTIQTLSSPSSLNLLNDPSSVVTEHYFLLSNDLTPDRSGVACKYQIDSLPWENFPAISNKDEDYNSYLTKPSATFLDRSLNEIEDSEVERAVQSITNLFDGFPITDLRPEKHHQLKLDLFNSDDTSLIDCFLDDVIGGSLSGKDHLSEFSACTPNIHLNIPLHNTIIDDSTNNLSEYQIDSNLTSDYEEKFETLINNAMNEFVTQSPQNIPSTNPSIDKKKSYDSFDPLKHCGVVAANGVFCHRSLLCKLHTMPQKRQVERSEDLTTLIKGVRDFNKIKRLHRKQAQCSNAFTSCNSSKASGDSCTYNCSSTWSIEEASSFMDNRLLTPDLDMSVLTSITDGSAQPISFGNTVEPRPLIRSRFQQEIFVNGNRSLIATKSLLWRNRPRSKCHTRVSEKYSSRTLSNMRNDTVAPNLPTVASASPSIKHVNDILLPQTYTSHYGLSSLSNDDRNHLKSDTHNIQLFSNNATSTHSQELSGISANLTGIHEKDNQRSLSNLFVSNNDLNLSTDSLNLSLSNINTISNMSSGFFAGACNNQVLNISPHFINGQESTSSLNSSLSFNNDNSISNVGFSLANVTNKSSIMTDLSSAGSSKFMSIFDEGSTSGSILYPIRNGNQIMMVMNKNNGLFNDQTEIFNDNFVSVNGNRQLTSMPLNSFFTLKPNLKHDGKTSVSRPQIVSISPIDLQRLPDSLNSSMAGQINLSADGSNIYQLNQSQPVNNCVPSSLTSTIESDNLAKSLTVQSSTLNGLTQKFIILPDGTISAFTQPPNTLNTTNFNQTQIQHPIFNQLTNYRQNPTYFINNDNIIIAPNSGITNGLVQQVLMPQMITQTDLNSHSSSALTFIQSQNPQSSKIAKVHNKLSTQIPVDSSQPKVSFQFQTPNQFQNQIPNTFFLTAANFGAGANIPVKQSFFVQSSEQLAPDISIMDSSGYFDVQSNVQNKSMDNMMGNSDNRTISRGSSQDFELGNHGLNPQSLIIQQPRVNRYSSKTTMQSNGYPSSLDIIKSSIESAHSSQSNGSQHIVVNNSSTINNQSNEQFAHSLLTVSNHRHVSSSTSYQNTTQLSGNQTVVNYMSHPPPLVISQQLLNQSVTNQHRQRPSNDPPYQNHSLTKASQLNQIPIEDGQFTNEYMIEQSMIA